MPLVTFATDEAETTIDMSHVKLMIYKRETKVLLFEFGRNSTISFTVEPAQYEHLGGEWARYKRGELPPSMVE